MKSLKITIMGMAIGIFVGVMSVIIAYAGLVFSGIGNVLPMAIAASAVPGSALAGLLGVGLGCVVTKRERVVLSVLIAVALASAIIMPGDYGNGSFVPPLIYAMAVLNGAIVAHAVGPFCLSGSRFDNHPLS